MRSPNDRDASELIAGASASILRNLSMVDGNKPALYKDQRFADIVVRAVDRFARGEAAGASLTLLTLILKAPCFQKLNLRVPTSLST